MGVKERLKEFLASQGIKDREFCRALGVSNSYINSLRKSMQPDKMKRLAEVYPQLNPMWLLTGEGNMLQAGNNNEVRGHHNTAVAGNGNQVTTNDMAGMIELQKGYQEMLREKDVQINRLISVIEKLSTK